MSQSKISRIEGGHVPISDFDVRAIALACRASDQVALGLLEESRATTLLGPSAALRESELADDPHALRSAEAAGRVISVFSPWGIPALLHTRAYSEEILDRYPCWLEPDERYRAVIARVERQAQLNDPRKRFRFLISEGAFRYWNVNLKTLCDQLAALTDLPQRSNVELRCLKPHGPLDRVLEGAFGLIDDTLVSVDSPAGVMFFRGPRELLAYTDLFETMWSSALSKERTLDLMRDAQQWLSHCSEDEYSETFC